MSPEQAKGTVVDKRGDVWAFGCVLYELLTGRRAFAGDSVSETIAAVLTADVDFDALPSDVPRAGRRLLRRCFEKAPKKRLRDMTEGLLQLEEDLSHESDGSAGSVIAPPQSGWRQGLPSWIVAVALAAATGIVVWNLRPPPSARPPDVLTAPLPSDTSLPDNDGIVAVVLVERRPHAASRRRVPFDRL